MARKDSTEKQRNKYKTMGLVQINAWIPANKKQEILEDCRRMKNDYLFHNRFRDDGDEE